MEFGIGIETYGCCDGFRRTHQLRWRGSTRGQGFHYLALVHCGKRRMKATKWCKSSMGGSATRPQTCPPPWRLPDNGWGGVALMGIHLPKLCCLFPGQIPFFFLSTANVSKSLKEKSCFVAARAPTIGRLPLVADATLQMKKSWGLLRCCQWRTSYSS